MKKSEENIRLLAAALAARDDLRALVLPACTQLDRIVAGHQDASCLVSIIRKVVSAHVDELRFAAKDRTARGCRVTKDLPYWNN